MQLKRIAFILATVAGLAPVSWALLQEVKFLLASAPDAGGLYCVYIFRNEELAKSGGLMLAAVASAMVCIFARRSFSGAAVYRRPFTAACVVALPELILATY